MPLLQLLLLASSLVPSIVAGGGGGDDEYVESRCAHECGNVSIVYPFGMDQPGCYRDKEFEITCNHSFTPPKPFIGKGNVEVAEIRLDEGQVQIMQWFGRDCYTDDGTRLSNGKAFLWLKRFGIFTINDTGNMLAGVGCDTYVIARGYQGEHSYTAGCMSLCSSAAEVVNGSCAGVGCCQTPIPQGLNNMTTTVYSSNKHKGVWDFSPCGYASIVAKDKFNFSSAYLKDFQNKGSFPMLLDWAIGTFQKCESAQLNRNKYACGEHADCYVAGTGSGYRCKCQDGYKGNPYLRNGCTDIDECKDPNLNDCVSGCQNNKGNYTCLCPKGHHGDGRRSGDRCVANRPPVVEITVGIGIGVVILIVAGSWLYFGLKKRKLMKIKAKFFEKNGGLMLKEQLSGDGKDSPSVTKIFTSEELKKATNNYDEGTKIGQGGFGTVYKGLITEGTTVAIKKSKTVDESQVQQFINEIIVLSKIKHKSIVKLLGCCLETEIPILVYEFISKGTLSNHIHNRSNEPANPWETRLKIAIETAIALSYMHSEASSTPIVHRDIKCNNILLDDYYNAKASDFGISRLVPIDQNQLPTMVMGTRGYLDPEYFHTGKLTEKSDVFSFGVVLLELLTGRKTVSSNSPEMEGCLVILFHLRMKENSLFEILDDRIVTERNIKQLKEIAELAKRCLMVRGEDRPTMREVVMELERPKMMVHHHPGANNELNP